MLHFFPAVEYEGLDTIIIEDVFMPEVIELLRKDEDVELLKKVFEYFEEVSLCEEPYLLNIFSITALEILGNEMDILAKAKKYMGVRTKELQIEADRDLGRFV